MSSSGKTGYDAYRSFSSGRSLVSGDPLPEWDALPPNIQEAWEWAATVIRREFRREHGMPEHHDK